MRSTYTNCRARAGRSWEPPVAVASGSGPGRMKVLMPARWAARIFSFSPPTGGTRPRKRDPRRFMATSQHAAPRPAGEGGDEGSLPSWSRPKRSILGDGSLPAREQHGCPRSRSGGIYPANSGAREPHVGQTLARALSFITSPKLTGEQQAAAPRLHPGHFHANGVAAGLGPGHAGGLTPTFVLLPRPCPQKNCCGPRRWHRLGWAVHAVPAFAGSSVARLGYRLAALLRQMLAVSRSRLRTPASCVCTRARGGEWHHP